MTITRASEGAIRAPQPASARPSPVVQLPAPPPGPDLLRIRPWPDALVEALGYDPRSDYVEQFWLAALGPSTCEISRVVPAAISRDDNRIARLSGSDFTIVKNFPSLQSQQVLTVPGSTMPKGVPNR